MKKIIIISITLLLLLTGCSDKGKNNGVLNHDELMAGDFSSIAGEYVNPAGHIVRIDEKGLKEGERVVGEPYFGVKVYAFKRENIETRERYQMTIYPIGAEVNEFVETDTSKIRIGYGNGAPINDDDIFTNKYPPA